MSVPYEYRCQLVRVVDGDTVEVNVDVGFRLSVRTPVRLAGINAPEMNTAAGHEAKDWLEEHLPEELTIQTVKPQDKYGRWLGWLLAPEGDSWNERLVAADHATWYDGRGS